MLMKWFEERSGSESSGQQSSGQKLGVFNKMVLTLPEGMTPGLGMFGTVSFYSSDGIFHLINYAHGE